MKAPSLTRCGGSLLAALIAFVSPAVNAAPSQSRPVQSEFAEQASRLTGDQRQNPLITTIEFPTQEARYVRLVILKPHGGEPCLDEIEVYGPESTANLALSQQGAVAHASSALAGYAIHAVAHLNDGLFGNDHSWIAAGTGTEWAQIELPRAERVQRVVISRDREGRFTDRQILEAEVRLSLDGNDWNTVAALKRRPDVIPRPGVRLTLPMSELGEQSWAGAVNYAFLRERLTWSRLDTNDYLSPLKHDRPAYPGGPPYWGQLVRETALNRILVQYEGLIERLEGLGVPAKRERENLAQLRLKAADPNLARSDELYLAARTAKRELFFRDPRLAPLERILFAKRHPLQPSHNYSEHLDSIFAPGGAICVLTIPRDDEGRLEPDQANIETLFDGSEGIVRDPVADFDGQTIFFAYRPEKPEVPGWNPYWHLRSIRSDGTGLRQLTEGPNHDFDPVPLPDGGLGFMSTRCQSRFLCWEPQAYVLHRMQPDGSEVRRLSHANLSEWDPSAMRDGRILWTRSEYQDKGADFGHTLWAIRPDGLHPELIFGNNTPYGYGHAREVPDSEELVCTLISHGDHQGPIALINPAKGRFSTAAITSITPDTRPQYQMDRSHSETFRDPEPISRDHFLVSHNPGSGSHWALYVIDRYGNRELLYLDPLISSKAPSPLRARSRPPVLQDTRNAELAQKGWGHLVIQNVYAGLGSRVKRGEAAYVQVSQEMPAPLEKLASGEYRNSHASFQDFYATPIHLVNGPARSYTTETGNALQPHAFRTGTARAGSSGEVTVFENGGWPSYVAKAVLGTAPVAEDGSVSFLAPAGRVLYFHVLDKEFNELQRMRSVVHLQPGEQRSCIGCHDERSSAPLPATGLAFTGRAPQTLVPPPWGAVPFDYERVLQPVFDKKCVSCHDTKSESKLDLRGTHDPNKIPASYRSLIAGGWVHYFDWSYGSRHFKAEPRSFGTLQSRLFQELRSEAHKEVVLEPDELRALKAWVDLNCPLWPDYKYRPERRL